MEEELYCALCLFTAHPKLRKVTKPNGWDPDTTMRWCPVHQHVRSGWYILGTDALTKDEIRKRIKRKREALDKLEEIVWPSEKSL